MEFSEKSVDKNSYQLFVEWQHKQLELKYSASGSHNEGNMRNHPYGHGSNEVDHRPFTKPTGTIPKSSNRNSNSSVNISGAGSDNLKFKIRPEQYPKEVINDESLAVIEKRLARMLELDNRSGRGLKFIPKNGTIEVKCSNTENAKFIKDFINGFAWTRRSAPDLVTVPIEDSRKYPHVVVRTPDHKATIDEIKTEVTEAGIDATHWRLTHTINNDKGKTFFILVDRKAAIALIQLKRPLRLKLAAFTGNSIVTVPLEVRKEFFENQGKKYNEIKVNKFINLVHLLQQNPS